MADKGSVFQKGGGGTNFEQYVQSAFLTTLILRGNIPCIQNAELTEIAFQTTNRGYQTDDLLAIAKSNLGEHRILAQIKHNLTFSDSDSNSTFKEVIGAFWKDFSNTAIFDKEKDRLVIIKSGLTKAERNHVRSLLNWAKTHNSESDYFSEVNRLEAKKEYLSIFRSVLKQVNYNKVISDKDLWQFLRCLDILEYDFLNEGGVDESYFINLIKLSRNDKSTSSEKEIWDSIYAIAAKHNKDGGNITIASISKTEIFKQFDILKLTPLSKSIQKLKNDSQIILKPLKNRIGGLHLERVELRSDISNSINNNTLTLVTGIPGAGKSAIVKDVLEKDFFESSVYVFRADQFNEPHLSNVFSKQGIHDSIQDIISCVSLIPEKLFVIDSLEKLLEGDPENAFKQLLSLLSDYSDIKVVATTRKYAVDLIVQKYGIVNKSFNQIEIPGLNEAELKIVTENFPQLVPVFSNQKLKTFLKSPKYLDFALASLEKETEDLSSISIKDFKKKLWNNIIEDITTKKSGLPRKRSKAFLNIAVKRAKQMKLFVAPDDNLEEGIEALERDEVIFQEKGEYRFSPTHDILEDWALIKYVESKHEETSSPKELFDSLGNEPAIRRAFRLWIEDNLVDDNEKISKLIDSTLQDITIEKYWADEVLIAIFRSENCTDFFCTFQEKLLENEGLFLNRCIHIIRTSCKESNGSSVLLPVGSGWKEILIFVEKNIGQLDKYRLSITNLLLEWELKLLFQSFVDDSELLAAKDLAIYFLDQVKAGDEFWQQKICDSKSKELISLLFNLAGISKTEIKLLVERSIKIKEDRANWKLNSFYRSVVEKCLSGLTTRRLIKELPELVVDVAWREWKLKICEEKEDPDDEFDFLKSSRLSSEECWGIVDSHSFFPSGVFKTPIYNLLFFHPLIGLKFITEFINYAVEFYVNAECEYKHKIYEIEIMLNDGTIKKQWAAWELWATYRGITVTHYALESILMSLEKYLLETASLKTKISRKNTQFIFRYLLQNSNNVAISGMLTSIAIAYPEEVGKEMLPLLTVKEFYEWDIRRSSGEHSAFSPMDNEILFAQKERHRLNQLPHRNKYFRGLSDFIIIYQFNIRTLNKEIHQIFDKLKGKLLSDEVIWKKILTEIDVRNHQIGEYDSVLGGFPMQTKYDEEVTEFINSGKEDIDAQNTSLNYSDKIRKAYSGKEEISFEFWIECFNYYSGENKKNILFDHPVSLSVLGLREFNELLSTVQKDWCIETIVETNTIILYDTINRNFGQKISYNSLEKEISIKAMHLVYAELKAIKDRNIIIKMMIRLLYAPFTDQENKIITEYMREVFFRNFPDVGKRIWIGLIKYAEFIKFNPKSTYPRNEKKIKAFLKKEQNFIKHLSSTNDLSLKVDAISFDSYESNILSKALVVTPYYLDDSLYRDFILEIIPQIIKDLKREEENSYRPNKDSRQLLHNSILNIWQYLAELFLCSDFILKKDILEILLKPVLESPLSSYRSRNDLHDFIGSTLDYFVIKLYDNGNIKPEPTDYRNQLDSFWEFWEYLFEIVKSSSQRSFVPKLFFDIRFLIADFFGNPNELDWGALENRSKFYYKMILELGQDHSNSIINVLSTVGAKHLLPEGLHHLTVLLQKNPKEVINLVSPSGERLIKKLFYNCILKIKNNKQLIADYIWILNEMVDLGSSQAYLFRENVITYKQQGDIKWSSTNKTPI